MERERMEKEINIQKIREEEKQREITREGEKGEKKGNKR